MLVRNRAGLPAQYGDECPAERVTAEQPVQITAANQPIRADAAVAAAFQLQHRALKARSGGFSEVHLVAADRHPGRQLDTGSLGETLGVGQNGLDVEKTEPGQRLFPAFHTERIGDAAAKHLVSTAQAEDPSPLAPVSQEI